MGNFYLQRFLKAKSFGEPCSYLAYFRNRLWVYKSLITWASPTVIPKYIASVTRVRLSVAINELWPIRGPRLSACPTPK